MSISKIENFLPEEKDNVKVTTSGNIVEIQYMEHRNNKQTIQKLNKEQYVDLSTGEIKQFEHNITRADDLNSVRKSMKKGRDRINTNIVDVTRSKMITVTYAENMRDYLKLTKDAEKLIKKLRYRYGHFEFITAAEPQGRGAWHLHIITIHPGKAPFIPNEELFSMWKHGWTFVKNLDDVDNVGAYLTAYLTDIPLEEAIEQGLSIGGFEIAEKGDKRYIKGARLKYYPPGMNIFRYSQGIKNPEVEKMRYSRAKEKVSSAKLTFSSTIKIEKDDYKNVIHKEYYNKNRK